MGKGTKRQLELAERLPNPRIGQCRIPHCRTLQPTKNMYGWMCWFHFRMVGFWIKRTGFDRRKGPELAAEAYCAWLLERAQRRKKLRNLISDCLAAGTPSERRTTESTLLNAMSEKGIGYLAVNGLELFQGECVASEQGSWKDRWLTWWRQQRS